MTIKRKLFLSNTFMVFMSLLVLLGIGGGLIGIFKDEFLAKFAEGSQISEYAYEVKNVLLDENATDFSMDDWSSELEGYGFRFYAYDSSGNKLYNNLKHGEKEAIETLDNNEYQIGSVKMFLMEGSTIAATKIATSSGNYTIIAVTSASNNAFWGMDRGMFEMFIIIFFVTGILVILGILIVNRFLTKRVINHIMNPLEQLNDAAIRIGDGNLDLPIDYECDDEFKPVCDRFDQMQVSLKDASEKQIAYEKARTEMVSGISHDLRTPLTSIKGYIKGMIDGIANTEEKRNHYLQTAYKKSCDMDVLLSKLFYFSKLETGNMPFFMKKTDIVAMLTQYVDDKKEESVDIRLDKLTYEEVLCEIDRDQMRRVFDNLLENSRKYAKREHLEIIVSTQMLMSENGKMLQISFADNGEGCPPDKIGHVFEQFYRGDEARNSKNDGNGLGLYVCKYIVEQQRGKIFAVSQDGFCVNIILPVADEEEREDG